MPASDASTKTTSARTASPKGPPAKGPLAKITPVKAAPVAKPAIKPAKPESAAADGRAPPDEPPVVRAIAMPADTNPAGDIFGGWLMAQMDMAAGSVAARRARGRCATVKVEGMTFLSPVYVGDEVSLYAELVSEGRSSMRIKVAAWRRSREEETVSKVTEAVFVFVAIGRDRRPTPLPPAGDGNRIR